MKGRFKLRSARVGKLPKPRKKRRKSAHQKEIQRKSAPARLQAPSPESIRAIIARLPSMHFDELMRIWQNAIRSLANSEKVAWHSAASAMCDAIGKEWGRRAKSPLDAAGLFSWPSTEAHGGDGRLDLGNVIEQGLLSYMEYRVGRTNGLNPSVRKTLLAEIFARPLPPVFPADYLLQWGSQKTAQRLQKIAESLAAFVRNAKRKRDDRLDDAIADWEHDLRFLYEQFYVRHFQFAWPTTKV
jgi:hypothetical protein